MPDHPAHRAYWRSTLRTIVVLLTIWAIAGFLLPIVLVEPLNAIRLGGFKLGFWFAQQGSIIIFVLLILAYCLIADRRDRRFHVEENSHGDQRDQEDRA